MIVLSIAGLAIALPAFSFVLIGLVVASLSAKRWGRRTSIVSRIRQPLHRWFRADYHLSRRPRMMIDLNWPEL